MKAATPDAYRVDAGADTRDYPGGVATRLSEQPTLPGRFSGPAAPASVVTAPTPVIRRTRRPAPTPKPATVMEAPQVGAIAPAVERTVIAVVPPHSQPVPTPAPAQDAAPRTTSAPEPRHPAPAQDAAPRTTSAPEPRHPAPAQDAAPRTTSAPEPRHPAPAQDAAPRTTSAPEPRHPAPAAARPAAESAAVRGVEPAAARSAESAAAPRPADADAAPAVPTSRFAPDADLTADQRSFASRPQAAPAREYAHFDEPVVSGFDRPQDEESDFSVSEGGRGVPSRADVALSRRAAHAHRLVSADQAYTRASEPQGRGRGDALASGGDDESVDRLPLRRDLPRRKKRSRRGLVMFLLGFVSALLLVAVFVAVLYMSRSSGVSSRGVVGSAGSVFVGSVDAYGGLSGDMVFRCC